MPIEANSPEPWNGIDESGAIFPSIAEWVRRVVPPGAPRSYEMSNQTMELRAGVMVTTNLEYNGRFIIKNGRRVRLSRGWRRHIRRMKAANR